MKNFLKYLGSIIILLGVIPLVVYHFGTVQNNTLLASAGIIMIVGAVLHVLLNKKIM